MTANALPFGDLFAQRPPFEVPKYQRSYAWEEEEIKDFVRDLEQVYQARVAGSPKKHFFGGIVCLQHVAQNALGRKYEVIDGQQRLATFGLFFAALRHWNSIVGGECRVAGDADGGKLADARADRLLADHLEFSDEVNGKPVQQQRIVLSSADKDFYSALLRNTHLTLVRESHKLLQNAATQIDTFIREILSHCTDNAGKLTALNVLAKASTDDCHVVHLVSEFKSEAYRLFEVLNDRGRNLSAGDLLRSNTLERLEGDDYGQSEAEKIWDQLLSFKASHVEKFLRVCYASVVGKRASSRNLFDDFLAQFFPSGLKPAETLVALKTLRSRFDVFDSLAEGDWPFEESVVTAWDRNRLKLLVIVLKNELCLPLLLAAAELDEKRFAAIVHMIEFAVFPRTVSEPAGARHRPELGLELAFPNRSAIGPTPNAPWHEEIGVLVCALLFGFTAFTMQGVGGVTNQNVKGLVSAGVPQPVIEKVKLGQPLSSTEEASLNEDQKDAIRLRQSAASSANLAVGMASSVWVFLGTMAFVSGLVGWLLVLKKDILQCHLCGAVTPAS